MSEETKTEKKVEETTAQAQTPQSGPVPNPEEQAADLNISDLNAIRSIIDIATQRGAFKANELEAVGKTYNKLTKFLESVSKQQQAQNQEQPQGNNNG